MSHALRSSIVNLDKNTTLGTPLCKNAGYAPETTAVIMTKRGAKLCFNNYEKQVLLPFVIYADFECLQNL